MVDADRAGMAHIRDHQRTESLQPMAFKRERIHRRQAPVLALGPERIGWRADRQRL
jgi:hypothetical protein